MPRLRYFKPICGDCGSARFVRYYLTGWVCFGLHGPLPSPRTDQTESEA